jgi:hypothetical protein
MKINQMPDLDFREEAKELYKSGAQDMSQWIESEVYQNIILPNQKRVETYYGKFKVAF